MSLGQQSARRAPSVLRLRIISAAVLMPVTCLCLWLGGGALAVLSMLLGAAMLWEVARGARRLSPCPHACFEARLRLAPQHDVCGPRRARAVGNPGEGGARGDLLFNPSSGASKHASTIHFFPHEEKGPLLILLVSALYIALAAVSLLTLRAELGPWPVLWLFALVWASDTAAFVLGSRFGITPLWPVISPDKTLEGLIAAIIAGSLVGLIFAGKLPALGHLSAAYSSAALAVVAQMGDLLESAVKRRLGVKNMSELIPGHGGVCDRLDSLLPVLILAAGLVWLWSAL